MKAKMEITRLKAEKEIKTLGETLAKIVGANEPLRVTAEDWGDGVERKFSDLFDELMKRGEEQAAQRLRELSEAKQFNPQSIKFYYNKGELEYSLKLDLSELSKSERKALIDDLKNVDSALYVKLDDLGDGRYVLTYPRHVINEDLEVKAIAEKYKTNLAHNPVLKEIATKIAQHAGAVEYKKGDIAKSILKMDNGELKEHKPAEEAAQKTFKRELKKERQREVRGSLDRTEMRERYALPPAKNAKEAAIEAVKKELSKLEENYEEAREYFFSKLLEKGDLESAKGLTRNKFASEYIARAVVTEAAQWTKEYPKVLEDRAKLAKALTTLKAEFESLGGKLKEKEAELEKTTKALQEKTAEAEKLAGELSEANKQVDKLTNEVNGLQSEVNALKSELETKSKEIEALNDMIAAKNDEIKKLEFTVGSLEAQRDKLMQTLENTQKELEQKTKEIDKLQKDLAQKDKDIAKVTQERDNLQASLQEAGDTIGKLTEKVESAEKEIEKKDAKIAELESANAEKDSKIAELEAKLKEMEKAMKENKESKENKSEESTGRVKLKRRSKAERLAKLRTKKGDSDEQSDDSEHEA